MLRSGTGFRPRIAPARIVEQLFVGERLQELDQVAFLAVRQNGTARRMRDLFG